MDNKVKLSSNMLIQLQLYYNIIVKYLIMDLHAPSALNYVTDIITVILLLKLICDGSLNFNSLKFCCFVLAFLCLGVLSAIVNHVSLILILWSIRNHGRFFVWVIIVANYLNLEVVDDIFAHLNIFAILNFTFMIYQYIMMGLRDDYLNGFFGSYAGGNSAVNTFAVILTIENISAVFTKRRSVKKAALYLGTICATCALNEIKFYFIEVAMIVLTLIIITMKKRVRLSTLKTYAGVLCLGLLLSLLGYQVLSVFYPGFASFFQKDVLIDYLTRSYNSSGIVYLYNIPIANRITAYGIILKYFLKNTFSLMLGLGLGAFERSSFFQSLLYEKYSELAIGGYLYPSILIENGIIGVIIFFAIYIWLFIKAKKIIKKNSEKTYYALIAGITSILGVVINIYNSALKIESSGYLFYTIIALVLCKEMGVYDKKNIKENFL